MDERENVLGFKPQKEIPYNALLPYADKLDAESNDQLSQIKANLARVVQLRDIKIGGSHWTGQLAKYLRLYGMKFSKQDHLAFIKLVMEMMTIPELDYSLIQKFAQLLTTLLKKRELIPRCELIIPWRPLYQLYRDAFSSPFEQHGLILLPENVTNVLKNLIRVCRVYFSVESTQEMLDEWRPWLCPFDIKMIEALNYLQLFLPTLMYPEEHNRGFRLWFDELISLWDACEINPSWEATVVAIFARLALDCSGYVDWEPYLARIFTRLLRSFNLPVGTKTLAKARINQKNSCYDPGVVGIWISNMLGGGSSTQSYLNQLFKALESFYHPSNYGHWNAKLQKMLRKLSFQVVKRVHRERYQNTWEPPVPVASRLTDDDVTQFVNGMMTVAFLAMFSKTGINESAAAIQSLATLRPELIIPSVLEKTYPALETLTEPHRLISCLQCTVSVSRAMLSNLRWYSDGRNHVIPLLNLCLPGIDPNDIKKSLMTFQLLSALSSLVPIVDCSEAIQLRGDLTEEEKELCSATSQFEDVVLQFFDRVFALVENSVHHHTRGSDSATADRLTPEESMLEMCLLSTVNSVMQQCSLPIYKEALSRLYRFSTESYFEIKVAGRFTADLVRATVKVHPEIGLKKFVPGLCQTILNRTSGEDLSKEEHLDGEFLWNLKLLSEIVRSVGEHLLPYGDDLVEILHATLHLKCKDALELSGNLLKFSLKAVSMIYVTEYRCSTEDWDLPLNEVLPIREWGKSGDLKNLGVHWHVPTKKEIGFIEKILQLFLVPELQRISQHVEGSSTLDREDLLQSLNVIHHCLMGAGSLLPNWSGSVVPLVEGSVDLTRFSHVATCNTSGIMLDGQNVRVLVTTYIRPLLDHMLSTSEDDTKNLIQLVKILNCLIYHHGTAKEEFDARWKSRHLVKHFMENKLLGKKNHIRALLIDRTQLQHELRSINQASKNFTELHHLLFSDLLRLSISRYMAVRKFAQNALGNGFHWFAYSYRSLLDDVIKLLRSDPSVQEHQFKGALYVVLGESKRSLITKRNWDVITRLWPALVQAQMHCEKPSMLRLFDEVIDKLHSDIETTELSLVVHQSAIDAAGEIWKTGMNPAPALPPASDEEMAAATVEETSRNEANYKGYVQVVEILVNLAETGNLPWKFHQVSFEMLLLLVRHDVRLPASGVRLFVQNMTHVTINVRKICTAAVSAILKQQKRKHKTLEFDPFEHSGSAKPAKSEIIRPGERLDNQWLLYMREAVPQSEDDWNKFVFVDKTHWGYYSWPRKMLKYAPSEEQPPRGRTIDSLPEDERIVYEQFTNAQYVETLIKFLTLEENKGKDRFHAKFFVLFKGLFRNFDDAVLEIFKPHVERLVADTAHDTHETSQRCAAEIIAGLIRGAKHWNYQKVQALWAWLVPVLKTTLSNFTVESIVDWGTCYATASENRDPHKLSPMFELMMDNPLNGEGGSFGDSSRLYLLQGALSQQEWRIPELLNRLSDYLSGHLRHPYKNVRDRIGSTLTSLFMYDIKLRHPVGITSPTRSVFIEHVINQLKQLRSMVLEDVTSGAAIAANNDDVGGVTFDLVLDKMDGALLSIDVDVPVLDNTVNKAGDNGNDEKDDERKTLINLCKTVLKWIQGICTRTFQCITSELLQFLPLMCLLESESKDPELQRDCLVTLSCVAQSLLRDEVIPTFLAVVKEVSQMSSWHARAAILAYLQVTVFCNLFVLQRPDVVADIRQLVLGLLNDDQLEVRELAGVTLGGFLHCGYLSLDEDLTGRFEKLSATRIKKRNREDVVSPELVIRRHAGVIGLSACILAFPYQVPDFMPKLLMLLSEHVNDPQPIQMTVKKTLGTFKRTHLDNWHDHKQKFTDDQLVMLTELLVSPNYYA